jgi:hypothetical protein
LKRDTFGLLIDAGRSPDDVYLQASAIHEFHDLWTKDKYMGPVKSFEDDIDYTNLGAQELVDKALNIFVASERSFRSFIWEWGTHYIKQVTMGGEVEARTFTSKDTSTSTATLEKAFEASLSYDNSIDQSTIDKMLDVGKKVAETMGAAAPVADALAPGASVLIKGVTSAAAGAIDTVKKDNAQVDEEKVASTDTGEDDKQTDVATNKETVDGKELTDEQEKTKCETKHCDNQLRAAAGKAANELEVAEEPEQEEKDKHVLLKLDANYGSTKKDKSTSDVKDILDRMETHVHGGKLEEYLGGSDNHAGWIESLYEDPVNVDMKLGPMHSLISEFRPNPYDFSDEEYNWTPTEMCGTIFPMADLRNIVSEISVNEENNAPWLNAASWQRFDDARVIRENMKLITTWDETRDYARPCFMPDGSTEPCEGAFLNLADQTGDDTDKDGVCVNHFCMPIAVVKSAELAWPHPEECAQEMRAFAVKRFRKFIDREYGLEIGEGMTLFHMVKDMEFDQSLAETGEDGNAPPKITMEELHSSNKEEWDRAKLEDEERTVLIKLAREVLNEELRRAMMYRMHFYMKQASMNGVLGNSLDVTGKKSGGQGGQFLELQQQLKIKKNKEMAEKIEGILNAESDAAKSMSVDVEKTLKTEKLGNKEDTVVHLSGSKLDLFTNIGARLLMAGAPDTAKLYTRGVQLTELIDVDIALPRDTEKRKRQFAATQVAKMFMLMDGYSRLNVKRSDAIAIAEADENVHKEITRHKYYVGCRRVQLLMEQQRNLWSAMSGLDLVFCPDQQIFCPNPTDKKSGQESYLTQGMLSSAVSEKVEMAEAATVLKKDTSEQADSFRKTMDLMQCLAFSWYSGDPDKSFLQNKVPWHIKNTLDLACSSYIPPGGSSSCHPARNNELLQSTQKFSSRPNKYRGAVCCPAFCRRCEINQYENIFNRNHFAKGQWPLGTLTAIDRKLTLPNEIESTFIPSYSFDGFTGAKSFYRLVSMLYLKPPTPKLTKDTDPPADWKCPQNPLYCDFSRKLRLTKWNLDVYTLEKNKQTKFVKSIEDNDQSVDGPMDIISKMYAMSSDSGDSSFNFDLFKVIRDQVKNEGTQITKKIKIETGNFYYSPQYFNPVERETGVKVGDMLKYSRVLGFESWEDLKIRNPFTFSMADLNTVKCYTDDTTLMKLADIDGPPSTKI